MPLHNEYQCKLGVNRYIERQHSICGLVIQAGDWLSALKMEITQISTSLSLLWFAKNFAVTDFYTTLSDMVACCLPSEIRKI